MRSQPAKPRPLTEVERGVLEFLLADPFPGRDEVRQQLENCLVQRIDEEGSLHFKVSGEARAPVTNAFPVQAEMKDEDGIPVRALLYVVDGIVRELDIWKGDGSKLIKTVTASDLRLVNPDEDIRLDRPSGKL